MFKLDKFFAKGLKNTIQIKDNGGFSYNGPFKLLKGNPVIDRWHVGDFSSAEYTMSVDYDKDNKEIIKFLVVGTSNNAKIIVYSRVSSNIDMVDIEAIVNNSYVDIFVKPKNNKFFDSRVIYTVNYFNNQNPFIS